MFKKTKPVDPVDGLGADLPTPVAATAPGTPRAVHAVYEVVDLAGLADDEATALLRQADQDAAAGLTDCAHLVVTQDLSTGVVNHHVPCGSGRAALALAARIVGENRAEAAARPVRVTITPLLPHDLGRAQPS